MEQELDLYALWQVIAKRWKLIVLIPLIAALFSALFSYYFITPQYRTSTTLMVTRPADASQIFLQDIQVSRQLVQTYREIARSRRVLELAIANRSLPYGVGELRGKVEVEAVRDTELITIIATDPDPQMASDIANEVARAFMDQIVEIMKVENMSVVDEAIAPGGPVSPRVNLNVGVAFLVGLMVSFGLAFLVEYLDRTIKDPAEAQRRLGVPLIGIVPRVNGEMLFTLTDPRSPPTEAFRTLRTNIQYSSVDRPVKRILVTGANPVCGKSTIAANLGVTLAQSGASVLLVDTDLRRPIQHKIFSLENEPGLSNLIFKEELELKDVIRKSGHDKLFVLPSGPIPPYPAEMLASDRMKRLVEFFTEKFEYIIFDSPPVIAVTDAALLTKLVDGTLFVLDYGKVKWDEAVGALEQLHKVQANIIGAVLNSVPHSNAYYKGYMYYYGEENISRSSKRKNAKKV